MKVKVKPTAGGAMLEVELTPQMTIAEAKEKIAPDVRLIYRGQILKDERTVESYGERTLSSLGTGDARARVCQRERERDARCHNCATASFFPRPLTRPPSRPP